MFRRLSVVAAMLSLACVLPAQERRSRIDVESYVIDAEVSQRTQTLAAKAAVRFVPLDDNINSVAFELNNALNVSKVVDDKDQQIPATRSQQGFAINIGPHGFYRAGFMKAQFDAWGISYSGKPPLGAGDSVLIANGVKHRCKFRETGGQS